MKKLVKYPVSLNCCHWARILDAISLSMKDFNKRDKALLRYAQNEIFKANDKREEERQASPKYQKQVKESLEYVRKMAEERHQFLLNLTDLPKRIPDLSRFDTDTHYDCWQDPCDECK